MTARSLFVGGTSSNAGKSWMTTAICGWLGVTLFDNGVQLLERETEAPCFGVCVEVFGVVMPSLAGKTVNYQQLALWFERHGRHLDRLGFD